MRQAVRDSFIVWSAPLEGRCSWMYLDMHEDRVGHLDPLVTTGVGNLIDPIGYATKLPWRVKATGLLATQQQVRDEWLRIKNGGEALARAGAQAAKRLCTLALADSDIDGLIIDHLLADEATLRRYFSGWDDLPADVQLAICSLAWGMGGGFPTKFPRFTRAVNARNFTDAANESRVPGFNTNRNEANRLLLLNGARVVQEGLDPTVLLWKGVATTPQSAAPPVRLVPRDAPMTPQGRPSPAPAPLSAQPPRGRFAWIADLLRALFSRKSA